MTTDKITDVMVAALKHAMAEPGEQRLYRSGKLPGLFAGRTSVNAEAAAQALREGLLEVVHTDSKGKTPIDWVRITAKGVDFVLARESPVRAMDELKAVLQLTPAGLPAWVAEIMQGLQSLSDRLTKEVEAIGRRLEMLGQRVTEALRRAQAAAPRVPEGAAGPITWTQDVLDHLERRRQGGMTAPCPLPELFAAVREIEPDVSVTNFHSGLRRLHDRGLLRLLPFQGPGELPEPEYALLDGATVIFYAALLDGNHFG